MILLSQIEVEIREVRLSNKPKEMTDLSKKGTVPVLLLPNKEVLDESINIMNWSLNISDPEEIIQSIKNNNQLIGYVGYLTSNELCNWLKQNNIYHQKNMYGIDDCNDTGMYIYNLCILQNFRRKKIASKVMKKILNKLFVFSKIFLSEFIIF